MDDDPLVLCAELLRLRAKAGEPLDVSEMFDLADALGCYSRSVHVMLDRINEALIPKPPVPAPLPLFALINGGLS